MRIFYYLLLLLTISFTSEAQQVKKIDCCYNVTPKATIIINESTSNGTTSSTTTTNPINGVFNFELKSSLNTSAGVYNSSGVLIRTLWSGVRYDVGCYSAAWDGYLDDGVTVASVGDYTIKLLTNNVQYTWEGGIGNTSGGSINGFGQITGFCFVGNKAYYGDYFAEGGETVHYLNLSDINTSHTILPGFSSTMIGNCTDGQKVYSIAEDQYVNPFRNFIIATNVSDDSNFIFSSGTNITAGRGGTLSVSAIGNFQDGTNVATNGYDGITVQQNGNFLFATRSQTNDLLVLNKVSGVILQTIKTSGGTKITITSDGAKLWMLESTRLNQYNINTDGTLTATGLSLPGGNIGFSLSPTNGELAIADDATCQIKFYNGSTGALNATLGRLNGYLGSPLVDNTKFLFHDSKTFAVSPVINFQPDGSFWVRDAGTYRWLHYNADKSYKEYFMYIPSSRSVCADPNVPTRIFADELEFQRDYSKALDNGTNGSWKLVNCWKPNTNLDIYRKFDQVVTLSNGKTYAKGSDAYPQLYWLSPAGAVLVDNNLLGKLGADGSLDVRTNFNNSYFTITRYSTAGFDSNYKPLYGTGTVIATTPVFDNKSPAYYFNNTYGAESNTGRYFFFNPIDYFNFGSVTDETGGTGYHLGAIKTGESKWDWLSSYSTFKDYHGDYPRDGGFDIGNNDYGLQHSENCRVMVDGKNIFWHVNAEFWRTNYIANNGVNIFNHYNDDGLLVANFGVTASEAKLFLNNAGNAGNSYSTALVRTDNGTEYIYHPDESQFGFIHSWKISGLSTISEQAIPLKVTGAITAIADPTDMMAGLPERAASFTGDSRWTITAPSGDAISTGFSKYQKGSTDIFIGSNYTKTVKCNLNNMSSLSSWALSGQMSFGGPGQPKVGGDNYNYLEVLDINSKVIARYSDNADVGNGYYHTTTVNNIVIKEGSGYSYQFAAADYKSFAFNYNNGSLSFSYQTYNKGEVINKNITSVFETGADLSKPAYLRISQGSPGNQYHVMDLYQVSFVKK